MIIKTYERENKKAVISISKEVLSCNFYENNRLLGEIEYPDKSYHYVDDAAENWITGVMTRETIDRYKSVA